MTHQTERNPHWDRGFDPVVIKHANTYSLIETSFYLKEAFLFTEEDFIRVSFKKKKRF